MRTSGVSLAICLAGLAVGEGAATQQPLNGADQPLNDDAGGFSKDLDGYIEGLMKEWNVPGLSVSIVHGDKTWAKGYGYATFNSTPATPHTLYYTGSTTKSFTAAAVSLLVDDATAHGLDRGWRTPVHGVLGEDFVLSDDWATAHVTLEDALCHRTGYPRHDLASAPTTREELRRLRHLPMTAEPRVRFQYSNKMFAVMGYLVETLTGKWLGDFLRERLWEPMGMNETYFSLQDAEDSPLDLATEYAYDVKREKHIEVPHEPRSSEEGAGSIVSNVLDYAKYLRVMMAEGAPLSKDGHREVKTPRSVAAPAREPFLGPVMYCFGWNQAVFGGEVAYFHSGAVTMFWSNMIMIPSRKMAVTTMVNTESRVPDLVGYRVLYDLLGVPEEKRDDMNKIFLAERRAEEKYLENCDAHVYPTIPSPPLLPTLPIADHVGEYANPGYGKLTIELYCYEDDRGPGAAVPTSGEQCRLRVVGFGGVGFAYLEPAIYLTPKSGDYWVGREYNEVGGLREVETPSICMRAEFRVGVGGEVTHFGLDARLEGEEGPLVWFERV